MSSPEAIAAKIRDVILASSLNLQAIESLTDNFTPPAVLVAINKTFFHTSNAGGHEDQFIVHVILAREPMPERLKDLMNLMSYSGSTSLRAVLEGDPPTTAPQTLSGTVDDLTITEAGPPVTIEVGTTGLKYIDLPFTVATLSTR